MKTKLIKTLALCAGLVAGANAYAAGNIYEIVPCAADGTAVQYPVATIDDPLIAGDTIYFKVRMARTMAMRTAGDQWKYDYVGTGSPMIDEFFSPLMIGIFVSGELNYARYVTYVDDASGNVRDFIFSYTTKAGDFALPIRLAGNDGKPVGYGNKSSEYLLLNTDKWQIVDASKNPATFQFGDSEVPVSSSYGEQFLDYTLAKSGFYVKSIRFDDDWEDAGKAWRIVNSGGTTTQSLAPRLVADSAPSNSVTLYVWSMDDNIVKVEGGSTVDMIVDYDSIGTPIKQSTSVGTITFAAGQTRANFTIKGGPAASVGLTTNLVLSAFPNYSFMSGSYERQTDYITVPVKCTDPLPPTVKATMDILVGSGTTVYATSDYLKPVATLTMEVSEVPASAFTVTLQPTFSGDATALNWWDYVYFAEATDLNDMGELSEFSESTKTDVVPSVTFSPTKTSHTLYLFALRADSRTNRAGHQMKFTPAWTAHPYSELYASPVACYIQAEEPEATISKGSDPASPLAVIRDDPLYLKIAVADTYADSTSKTGYTLTVSLDETGALSDPDPITNLVAGAGGFLYVANPDGTPSSTLPSVKYGLSSAGASLPYFTSTFTVTSPESGLTSAPVTFYVNVNDKTAYTVSMTNEETGDVYTGGTPKFSEGDEVTFTITLDKPNMLGRSIYAYLAFKGNLDAAAMFEADDEEFIVGMNDTIDGLEIRNSESVAEGTIKFLDNAAKDRIEISRVYFSYDSQLDSTNLVNLVSYDFKTSASVTKFGLSNVLPSLSKIKIGTTSLDPETIYTTKLPLGAERRFTPVVKDVLADLNATNDIPATVEKRFQTMWSTYCFQIGDGESVDDYTDDMIPGLQFEQMDAGGEGTVLFGNPNSLSFTNTFEVAGIWKISCQIKDKDTDEFSDQFSLYMKVTDAGVSVSKLDSFYENDKTQQLEVSLNYYDSQFAGTVFVALKVKSNAADAGNPGRFKFNDSLLWTNVWPTVPPFELAGSGTVTNAADAAADYYLLRFASRNQLTQKLSMLDVDGVNDTFTYNAYVVSAQTSGGVEKVLPASNKLAAEYYAPSDIEQVTVFNTDPSRSLIRVSPNPDVNTNIWTSAKTISWTVPYNADVAGDFDGKITVSITGDGMVENYTTNITGTASGSFLPNFGGASGAGEVVLTISDKDGGVQEYSWQYDLPAIKTLVTIPNGPTGIGNSALSQKYVNAEGRGRGHIYPVGASIASVTGFSSTWFCTGLTEVPVYGFGYKAGTYDNGWLNNGRDQAIKSDGTMGTKATSAAVTDGYYGYAGVYGGYTGTFDSYLYAWLIAAPTSESGESEWSLYLAPENPEAEAVPAYAALPSEPTEDDNYVPVKVEAVFAREWLEADNAGDINLDGVPDIFATKVWRNASNASLLKLFGGADSGAEVRDLVDLASYNPDKDQIPGVYSQSGTLGNTSGYDNSYAPVGIELDTRREIRGFDLGLNATDLTKSDISFSDDETFAWTNWLSTVAVDRGLAFTNETGVVTNAPAANLSLWTPEPGSALYLRMDPTLEDTDDDGFPDGWEYFFWYQAKVWHPSYRWRVAHPNDLDSNGNKLLDADSNKNHLYPGQPRAGQFCTFERFDLGNITKGIEITPDEVMAHFDPCAPYEPENFTGSKHLKYDFDGDGLSDLEELLIGTNPCHWDTDGDRLCDAWEVMMCLDPINGDKTGNPDGDFMAYYVTRHDMCWIDPSTATVDPTTSAIDPYAEGTRIYALPSLQAGLDYDISIDLTTLTTKYVMLRTVETMSCSFTPKYKDGEKLVYGHREDIPNPIPTDWISGWYMVDDVDCEKIKLTVGTELTPDLQFVLIHDQVHSGFGFDPRTAWYSNGNGYVADRWDPAHNGDNVTIFDQTGKAVNTRPYSNYDEYLVMKYRLDYGIDYSPTTQGDDGFDPNKEAMWDFIRRKTTNPNVVNPVTAATSETTETLEGETTGETEGETAASTGETASATIAAAVAEAFNKLGSNKSPVTTHGADTDQDGVPDGWELYMYRSPNAAPSWQDEDGLGKSFALDFDGDNLSWASEYAGVDSCDAYKGCESIYNNHPGKKDGWWNKFFPTNPGTMKSRSAVLAGYGNADGLDTDMDGVQDETEGGIVRVVFSNHGRQWLAKLGFIYGLPENDDRNLVDDGLTVCFRGGGMNPCTIDTDLDGIPDGWELQHAGVPVKMPGKTPIAPRGGNIYNITLDAATFIADGVYSSLSNAVTNVVYIAGGMDATWGGDAVFDSNNYEDNSLSWDDLLLTRRDVDFDHDGLQNYQEYLTQSIRHFRYDDITTPLMGRQLHEGTYSPGTKALVSPHTQSFGDPGASSDGTGTGYPVFDPADPETFAANAAEAWNGRSFVYYETVTTGVRDVVKVVDAYTGASTTNRIYYTAQKKRFTTGAALVSDCVANGGSVLQRRWDSDGWREIGYFAPPRREWDRATASAKILDPLYMYPITEGAMVGSTYSLAGYATTDPRIDDTDGDGMDDFYEMYHGLNPLLGTTPATAGATFWIGEKGGDIVSAQYYMSNYPMDSRDTFNAWYNEWIYPTYNGRYGREGAYPDDAVGAPIQVPQAYDPVLYPWSMGTALVDADGDGIRNDEERIVANVADPVARHTDPSPLWFTERTTPASYVAQYYGKSAALAAMPWYVATDDKYESAALKIATDATSDVYFWDRNDKYSFSFEENEGYDTDGDMTPDTLEVVSTVGAASDPLKFDDPVRRQALYLPGSASYAMSRDLQYRPVDAPDFLKQFTVECWVLPEKSGAAQTIIDRSVAYEGDSINTDALAIRANFRIGLDDTGNVYGMFDNNDSIESGLDAPRSCQFVDGGSLPLGKWSHVALTFDGSKLAIYVNGLLKSSATTTLIPANGVVQAIQNPGTTNRFPGAQYTCTPCALLIGARPKKGNYYALYPYFIEQGVHKESFANLQEYFKGYIDEVRVWDGARTGAQILETHKKSFGFAEAAENRASVFKSWYNDDGTRNANDGNPTLPPELVLNYDFSTLPGAVNQADVAKVPAGYTESVLYAAMSDYASNPDIDTTGLYSNLLDLKGVAGGGVEGDLLVGWWNESLVHSTVYDDYHVVPWIKNTVSHLPLMDGGAVDSFIYAEDFGAVYTPALDLGVSKLIFPNSGMPYPATVFNNDRYYRLAHLRILCEQRGSTYLESLAKSRFQVRNNFVGTADLVPMGGAFAKTCQKMWDGYCAADPWEQTGDDTNGDGIPDWWEEYARHNYATSLAPSDLLSWDTIITYNGEKIPAGRAYMIDIYRGMQPDGTIDPAYAVSVDLDGDGMPDWWERLYGIASFGADDDTDGDGLSNYVEYLLAEVFNLANFIPTDPCSINKSVSDYFFKVGSLYAGEIFTDHDTIADGWEHGYMTSEADVSPYLYDADRDPDGDGWSNYDEFQAGTDPLRISSLTVDSVELEEFPIPTVELTVTYKGTQNIANKSLVLKAWSDQTLTTIPDAVWTLGSAESEETNGGGSSTSNGVAGVKYFGMNPKREMMTHLSPGCIEPGSVKFEFKDLAWILYDETNDQVYTVEDSSSAVWAGAIIDKPRDGSLVTGDIVYKADTSISLGSIDYATGEMKVDFTAFPERYVIVGDISGHMTGNGVVSIYNLQSSYVRVTWRSKLASNGERSTYFLSKADDRSAMNNSLGHLKSGANTFIAFYDLDLDGMYTPGEPYGSVRDVNVGWNYAKASITLTDTSIITPRYKLTTGGADETSSSAGEDSVAATDREALFPADSTDVLTLTSGFVAPKDKRVRIRIVRYAVDSFVDGWLDAADSAIVFDREYDLSDSVHPTITEADILSSVGNEFDLDWDAESIPRVDGLSNHSLSHVLNVVNGQVLRDGATLATCEKVYYTVNIGHGNIQAGSYTNASTLSKVLVRKFNRVRTLPTPIVMGDIKTVAPKFSWAISNDTTYTAFKVTVKNLDGTTLWTSDYQRMPSSSATGIYEWTAPLRVGAKVPGGTDVFANGTNYTWAVSAYNSKYKTDAFVSGGSFYVNVPENSSSYGTANVAVRYYGPTAVSSGLIRVQAFRTPDFSGELVGEGYVTSTADLASTSAITNANASIIGLPPGTYYIRAFIDTVNDSRISTVIDPVGRTFAWESRGCFCVRDTSDGTMFVPKSVTVGPGRGEGDIIPIYIEDCDTDGDTLPDAWEWVTNGDLATYSSAEINDSVAGFSMNTNLTGKLTAGQPVVSGLETLITKSLSSTRVAALALGMDATGSEDKVVSSLVAAANNATPEPTFVVITGVEFDKETGKVYVTAQTEGTSTGGISSPLAGIYQFADDGSPLTLTLTLWHRASLDSNEWTSVGTQKVNIEKSTKTYEYDFAEGLDLSSGFFKVTLE